MEAAPNGAASGTSSGPLTKVMVFCDGTWCGPLTGTNTNVKILADAIAHRNVASGERFHHGKDIVGCYFDGEGVQGGFVNYIVDGAIGGRIKQDCLEAYRFIMDKFEDCKGHCEAWLIGLSRGSYTVRCVAGMINNCGLISKTDVESADLDRLVNEAYQYYRDRGDLYTPNCENMQKWKREHSRKTPRPPVKFMGLFETVGALGIPGLHPGMGVDNYDKLNFYGNAGEGSSAVSGEVERVYQALAVHDRFTIFSPCHVKRDKTNEEFSYSREGNLVDYKTEELWFPGAHYDLGRQKFMFYKSPSLLPPKPWDDGFRQFVAQFPSNLFQRAISLTSTRVLRIPDIHPNYGFSDLVLAWMTRKMAETDTAAFRTLHTDTEEAAQRARPPLESIAMSIINRVSLKPAALKNDAYDHLLDDRYLGFNLVPFAHCFLVALFNRYLLEDRTIRDPLPGEPPVRFLGPESHLVGDPQRYRSRSYDTYKQMRTNGGDQVELVNANGTVSYAPP